MSGQGDFPLNSGFFSSNRVRRSKFAALYDKSAASDRGVVPWKDFVFQAAASGVYTITVTGASVSIAGQSQVLRRVLPITVTGQGVTLAGQGVSLAKAYRVVVSGASVSIAGQSVSLTPIRNIAVTGASVSLSGQSVTARLVRPLTVSAASVTLAGQSVTLTYIPASVVYTLTVTGAQVAIDGQPVTLTYVFQNAPQTSRGDDAGPARRAFRDTSGQSKAFFDEQAARELSEKLAVVARHVKAAKRPQKRDREIAAAKRHLSAIKPVAAPVAVSTGLEKLQELVAGADDLTGVMMALAQIEAVKQVAERVRIRRRREEDFIAAFLARVA